MRNLLRGWMVCVAVVTLGVGNNAWGRTAQATKPQDDVVDRLLKGTFSEDDFEDFRKGDWSFRKKRLDYDTLMTLWCLIFTQHPEYLFEKEGGERHRFRSELFEDSNPQHYDSLLSIWAKLLAWDDKNKKIDEDKFVNTVLKIKVGGEKPEPLIHYFIRKKPEYLAALVAVFVTEPEASDEKVELRRKFLTVENNNGTPPIAHLYGRGRQNPSVSLKGLRALEEDIKWLLVCKHSKSKCCWRYFERRTLERAIKKEEKKYGRFEEGYRYLKQLVPQLNLK